MARVGIADIEIQHMHRCGHSMMAVVAVLMLASVMAVGKQAVGEPPRLPGIPDTNGATPEWLPGIWRPDVYEGEADSVVRVSGYGNQHRFEVDDEGAVQATRWRQLLPLVEVAFHSGNDWVLREDVEGETREFSLNLASMTVFAGRPTFTGILRVETDNDSNLRFYRVVWRKLPDDFFDGPL